MKASFLIGLLVLALSTPGAWGDAPKKKHVRGTVPIPTDMKNGPKAQVPPQQAAGLHPTTKQAPDPTGAKPLPEGDGARNVTAGAKGEPPQAPGPGKACEQKHPIETFVQISNASSPQAARGGGVYFLSDLREAPQIFYLKSADGWPEQVTFFPDGVPYFRVSPDGEKILAATHQGGDEQYEIHLIEPKKHAVTPLLVDRGKRVESVAWAPTSDWFAFTANDRNKIDFDLYRYDLNEKKATMLAEISGSNTVTDVSPSGKLIALENYRSITDSDVLVYDTAKKELSPLTKHSGDVANHHAVFSADSQGVFYLSDAEKGIAQLYYLTLAGSAPGALPKPGRLLTTGPHEVEDVTLDFTRTSLAYLVNDEGYSRLQGLVVDSTGHKKANLPLPMLPDGVVRSVSFGFGKLSKSFFYSFTSSTQTSDIWQWKSPDKTQWTRSTQGGVRAECFTRETLVHYPSFDQKQIPAFLYRPESATGPIPFIVYVHGGPESQFRPVFAKTFQYFLERGFGVFAPNVRGSAGYGREYTMLDNYKKRMDSVQDAVEGARWLISQGLTRPGNLAIYGGSYGGFMVLRSIEVDPELFAAASESVGISDFVTFLKNTKPYRRALREVEYGPLSDTEFLKSISPMTYLDRIKTPLLIFHGANDPRVPVSEAEQILRELKKRDVPVESRIFQDEGHGNAKLRNIMEQARTMVYFFEKYVGKKDEKK